MSLITDKKQDLETKLIQLGLHKNEAQVYLSLLKLGEVGASKVVTDTMLHGQTVYTALDTLIEKNLVKFVLVNNRKKFSAQSPSILLNLIEQRRAVATDVVTELESRFSTVDLQSIEILKGNESFVANEFKVLSECKPGTNLLIFGGLGDSYIQNMSKHFNEYEFQRKKKQIGLRYLGSREQTAYLNESKDARYRFDYHFLPGVFSGVISVCVFEGVAVSIYLFDETVTTITLRNKKIVESYTGFFEGLWRV